MMAEAVTVSQALNSALKLPNGARFYRCALQSQSFRRTLSRNNKSTKFTSEAEYNAAIVSACLTNRIE